MIYLHFSKIYTETLPCRQLYPLCKGLFVFTHADARVFFKQTAKVFFVAHVKQRCKFRRSSADVFENIAGGVNLCLVYVFDNGVRGGGLENAAQVSAADRESVGNVADGNFFVNMLCYVLLCPTAVHKAAVRAAAAFGHKRGTGIVGEERKERKQL